MCAGFPLSYNPVYMLRLVRYAVGPWNLDGLAPGAKRFIEIGGPADTVSRIEERRQPPCQRLATRRR